MALALPVRLTDMEAVEGAYRAATADARLELHAQLVFHDLLNDGERALLERRFPEELAGDPKHPEASFGCRAAWDFRARELVVAMLCYGDELLKRQLDLVGAVEPARDVAVLALTATGSVVELGRPDGDGKRPWVYRPSARQRGKRRSGRDVIDAIRTGDRLQLGRVRTSETLALAAGPTLASTGEVALRRGALLFTPAEDTGAPELLADELRAKTTRYRVLVDAAGNAVSDGDRRDLGQRALRLALEIQRELAPEGGRRLVELAHFKSSSGSRYDVAVGSGGAVDVTRHAALGDGITTRYGGADIGAQTVVVGAPLVIEHEGDGQERVASFIHRVAALTGRGAR